LGIFSDWSEEDRVQFLLKELNSHRPLVRGEEKFFISINESVREVLQTFDTLSKLNRCTLGSYVISMSKNASDVLAVELLQKEAGIKEPLGVCPLFEMKEDLIRSQDSLRSLLKNDWYRQHIKVRGLVFSLLLERCRG